MIVYRQKSKPVWFGGLWSCGGLDSKVIPRHGKPFDGKDEERQCFLEQDSEKSLEVVLRVLLLAQQ